MLEDTRFSNVKAHIINYENLTEIMQQILGDNTLEIDEDYPCLSFYSRLHYRAYEEDTVMKLIGEYLGVEIAICFKFDDLEEVYFIENE